MSYATVEDVEDRAGYTFETEQDVKKVQIFLDDASAFLDFSLSNRNIDTTTIPDALKRTLVASKGVLFADQMNLDPNVVSWSQSDDGAAEAKTFRATSRQNLLRLTNLDLVSLGIKTFKFSSFSTEYKWGDNR